LVAILERKREIENNVDEKCKICDKPANNLALNTDGVIP